MITILYEENLIKSKVGKKIEEKEGEEFKKIYNHYLDKCKDIMKNTEKSYNETFGAVSGK